MTTTQDEQRPPARIAPWQWAVALVLFSIAGYRYFTATEVDTRGVFGEELHEITVPAGFSKTDRIEATSGTLRGSNVLLVTLDTTRADRIGCYGNERIQTPVMDRLADKGVIFSKAHATAPTTTPTHSSILTGLYPVAHGVRVNGFYKLADEHTTLAEDFAGAGYETAAFLSAFVLDRQFGLDQGFEIYNDDLSDADAPPTYRYKELQGDTTTDRAIAWLNERETDRPFFAWVHYFDPHAPYAAPEQYQVQSSNVYDAEIAFTDAQIGRLIDTLETQGLTEDTLVIVIADHGESLYQHNEGSHAMLVYDASTRIPWIMAQPGKLPGKVHIERRVSQVDLRPTLRSLFGMAETPTDGVDLTQAPTGSRTIFVETLHPMLTFGWAPLFAAIEGDEKLIYGPGPELYDLAADPHEQDNLFGNRAQAVTRLTAALRKRFGDLEDVSLGDRNVPMSAADLQKLQALGYVGSETIVEAGAERPNPRDMMAAFIQVEAAVYAGGAAAPATDRVKRLEALRAEYPSFVPLFRFLGDAYLEMQDFEAAEGIYKEAVRLQPNAPEPAFWLVMSQMRQEKIDEALETCLPILEKYPDYTNAAYVGGGLLLQKGRFDEASDLFWSLFERSPDFEQVASVIVDAFAAADRLPELRGKLETWIERDPVSVPARTALANLLLRDEQVEAAVAVLRAGYELAPEDPMAAAALAFALVARPDAENRKFAEAIDMMEQANASTGYSEEYLLYVLSVCYSQVGRLDEGIGITKRAIESATASQNGSVLLAANELLKEQERAKAAGIRPVTPSLEGLGVMPTTQPEAGE